MVMVTKGSEKNENEFKLLTTHQWELKKEVLAITSLNWEHTDADDCTVGSLYTDCPIGASQRQPSWGSLVNAVSLSKCTFSVLMFKEIFQEPFLVFP